MIDSGVHNAAAAIPGERPKAARPGIHNPNRQDFCAASACS
jgi:hypothetical protein